MLGDALVKSGKTVEGEHYLQAAREHESLYKLIERASTEDGRQNLSLLKELGAAYQRVGLIPEAKAWYKLALARDPTDPDVQAALYHLGRRGKPNGSSGNLVSTCKRAPGEMDCSAVHRVNES